MITLDEVKEAAIEFINSMSDENDLNYDRLRAVKQASTLLAFAREMMVKLVKMKRRTVSYQC